MGMPTDGQHEGIDKQGRGFPPGSGLSNKGKQMTRLEGRGCCRWARPTGSRAGLEGKANKLRDWKAGVIVWTVLNKCSVRAYFQMKCPMTRGNKSMMRMQGRPRVCKLGNKSMTRLEARGRRGGKQILDCRICSKSARPTRSGLF